MLSFEQRLWAKVDRRGEDECWPWLAGTHKGYGRLRKHVNGRWTHISAAKAVWESVNGPMPEDHEPDHTCNNPGCCNPKHVEAVTHSENMQRIWRRQRGATGHGSGELAPRAKFTRAEVEAIKLDPRSNRTLARALGVTHSVISRIRQGRTYRHDTRWTLRHR